MPICQLPGIVMGLNNGNAMFHTMEWVLRDLENADPYVDAIIFGSTGENMEENWLT